MNLNDINDIDIGDISSWPEWFKWFMVLLLCGGILFGGYKFFIKPEMDKLTKLEKKEVDLKKEFTEKKAQAINLDSYREQMIEMEERFDIVLRQLPDRTEIPALLVDISQAGLSRDLKFKKFKPGKLRSEEFYLTLPIEVEVQGTYHQLAEFISDISAMDRIVVVGDTKIKRDKGSELEMTTVINTFQYSK